jgi:hypothetical protein
MPAAAFGGLRVTAGVMHLVHLVFPPKALYEPIVVDAFPFWTEGFSKTYSLAPIHKDIYEVGLLATNVNLSSKAIFTGKVKVEFLWQDMVVSECEITAIQGGVYAGKDMTRFRKASLMHFKVPIDGKYMTDISVRMTVLEADRNLEIYGESLQMFIGVSSSP